jgi:cytochrome P450
MIFLSIINILVGLFVASLLFIYWKIVRPGKHVYDILRRQGVPGEPFVPIIGQLLQLRRYRANNRTMAYFDDLKEKHGNLFLFSFGSLTRLIINEPDMLVNVLSRSNSRDYIKPPELANIFKSFMGVHNLMVSEGAEHERSRQIINPVFHSVNLQSMVSVMNEQTEKAITKLFELLSTDQRPVDLHTMFQRLTLSIILSSMFGKSMETTVDMKEVICRALTEILEAVVYRSTRMINRIPLLAKLPFWRKHIIDDRSREIAHFINQTIADRKNDRSNSICTSVDLLDLLLSVVDHEGQPLTDQEIKEQALTFIIAGHESTSNLMSWIMYILMTNEAVLEACQKEVDRVLSDGIEVTCQHINDLVICEAVVKETLRLYPTAPFIARQCTYEKTIGSVGENQLRIPVGTAILISPWLLHRRAEFWPRPLEFDYTRWLRDPVTGLKPKLTHPFCYLPFGAGPRNCIGQNFAVLEAKIILAQFVKKCCFVIEPGQIIAPEFYITLRPKFGLLARVSKR